MKHVTILSVLGLSYWLPAMALGLTFFMCAQATAEAIRPSDDAVVLATVKPRQDGQASGLQTAQLALASDPNNVSLALRTARMAIEEGRTNADPRLYGQAQAAIAPWWREAAPPEDIRVLRAVIFQAFHDFKSADRDLTAVLESSPGNAQARLSRAFIRMVTGDTEGARQDCQSLPARAGQVVSQICQARVESLTGAGDLAYQRLQGIAVDTTASAPMTNFARAMQAEIAASLGRSEEAGQLYRDTLASGAVEVSLLVSYADLLLDASRPADALKLLDGKGQADIVILRQAIAAKRLGDPRLAGWEVVLDERFAASKAGGIRVHLREEARYQLEVKGNPSTALDLARQNWRVQKEPADAMLLLETSLAAADKSAANEAVTFIERTGLKDQRLEKFLAQYEGQAK